MNQIDLESRTRNSIKAVLPCDATQPLSHLVRQDVMVAPSGGFSVVIASLVFDVVATDGGMFANALRNVQDILLPAKGTIDSLLKMWMNILGKKHIFFDPIIYERAKDQFIKFLANEITFMIMIELTIQNEIKKCITSLKKQQLNFTQCQ